MASSRSTPSNSSKKDGSKQRPIQRVVRKREDKHLLEERFMDLPIIAERSLSGQYGWVSPFIVEVRRDLHLKPDELPSKKPDLIPMLVEKAAQGIIEEGKQIRKEREAEILANMLLEQKNNRMEEVWKTCAYMYSLESFLYRTLNSTMRLTGNMEDESIWRKKIQTLGPFCLLLWDDPFNEKITTKKILYRGANLNSEQIATYEEMAKNRDEYRSFQAFTSTSRNRLQAEKFGNTLFIMKVVYAFIADISSWSGYQQEQEELITPGVCCRVQRIEFDSKTNKHLIYLELRQRFSGRFKRELGTNNTSSQGQTSSILAARLAAHDSSDLSDNALSHIFSDIDFNNLTDADAALLDDVLGFTAQRTRHGDINKEVRMVLIGATGNGKSSFGNTIIGASEFKAKRSGTSVTQECQVEECKYEGKELIVVDTPGFFDTNLPAELIEDEITKSYQILAPGPQAFLIVHNVCNRLTEEQLKAAKQVTVVFGKEAANFCVIVFTGIDALEDEGSTIEEYLGSLTSNNPLKELLNNYGGRYIAVNNKGTDTHKKKVIDELLRLVQTMVSQTANGFYETSKFKEVIDIVNESKAQGHVMVNPNGSIVLIPEVKKIVHAYLCRNLARDSLLK